VLVDCQSVHRPHCKDVIGPLPGSVHARRQGRLYVPLRGSCIPSLQYAAQRKPKRQIQCIMTGQTVRTPQRQLYSKPPVCSTEEAKETDPVHYDKEVRVQPATKLLESLSHGSGLHQLPEERGHLLRTQSLTR
jgi:hypothetical protein